MFNQNKNHTRATLIEISIFIGGCIIIVLVGEVLNAIDFKADWLLSILFIGLLVFLLVRNIKQEDNKKTGEVEDKIEDTKYSRSESEKRIRTNGLTQQEKYEILIKKKYYASISNKNRHPLGHYSYCWNINTDEYYPSQGCYGDWLINEKYYEEIEGLKFENHFGYLTSVPIREIIKYPLITIKHAIYDDDYIANSLYKVEFGSDFFILDGRDNPIAPLKVRLLSKVGKWNEQNLYLFACQLLESDLDYLEDSKRKTIYRKIIDYYKEQIIIQSSILSNLPSSEYFNKELIIKLARNSTYQKYIEQIDLLLSKVYNVTTTVKNNSLLETEKIYIESLIATKPEYNINHKIFSETIYKLAIVRAIRMQKIKNDHRYLSPKLQNEYVEMVQDEHAKLLEKSLGDE